MFFAPLCGRVFYSPAAPFAGLCVLGTTCKKLPPALCKTAGMQRNFFLFCHPLFSIFWGFAAKNGFVFCFFFYYRPLAPKSNRCGFSPSAVHTAFGLTKRFFGPSPLLATPFFRQTPFAVSKPHRHFCPKLPPKRRKSPPHFLHLPRLKPFLPAAFGLKSRAKHLGKKVVKRAGFLFHTYVFPCPLQSAASRPYCHLPMPFSRAFGANLYFSVRTACTAHKSAKTIASPFSLAAFLYCSIFSSESRDPLQPFRTRSQCCTIQYRACCSACGSSCRACSSFCLPSVVPFFIFFCPFQFKPHICIHPTSFLFKG